MRYPINNPSDIPGSGSAIYQYLMENLQIPSRMPHEIWYNGQKRKLDDPHSAFKGFYPVGQTIEVDYAGAGMKPYEFTGKEKNAVYVRDLSKKALFELGIPTDANPSDKVFNPNFVAYDDLPHETKVSNEATTMSLAKSFSSFLCGTKSILYTEEDVASMLQVAIRKVNSIEMMHILHGNHVAWCALAFMRSGKMEADIQRQFYGQNDIDFYIKDIGTIMPAMLYCLAILGIEPMEEIKNLKVDLYGIEDVARTTQDYMKRYQRVVKAA